MQNLRIPTPFSHLPLLDPGVPPLTSVPKLMWWIATGMKRLLISGTLFGIVGIGSMAAMPGFIGQAVQAVSDQNQDQVNRWAGLILLLGAFTAWTTIARHRRAAAMWITCASRLQQLIALQAKNLGADLPKYVSTGEVVSVNSNDVERVARGFDLIPRFIGAVISFIVVAIILVRGAPTLGWVVVLGVPVLVTGIAFLIKPLEKRESVQRTKLSRASDLASDTVAGLRVLRGIGGEDVFVQRFKDASQEVRVAAVHTARMRAILHGLEVLLPGILLIGVVWGGGLLVAAGDLQIGTLVAFAGYSVWMVLPIQTMVEFAQRWASASVSGKRILKLLSVAPTNQWGTGELTEVNSIRDLKSDLQITAGDYLVVVSDSSTETDQLVERIGGYLEVTEVEVNSVKLSSFTKQSVRAQILLQEKDPTILSGTVETHFAVEHSGQVSIDTALTTASADDILDSLDGDGRTAEIIERGRTLSGGQRQRLALARSLFVDPPVLILDEPTSAVDAHSEARIAARIRELRGGKTTVIFSSSPLILDTASKVALLVENKVVATGTHQELLRTNEIYRTMVVRGE
jgi:ABC-type multidrug transport system fused ATPase/permease subunit